MNVPDFSIAKFNIPISIKRAFDKGKIADSYKQMYSIADTLATAEANQLLAQKKIEYLDSRFTPRGRSGVGTKSKIPEIQKEVLDYKTQRLDFHMNNMIRMLEMHVNSKQNP